LMRSKLLSLMETTKTKKGVGSSKTWTKKRGKNKLGVLSSMPFARKINKEKGKKKIVSLDHLQAIKTTK
jgi:hypothetical protein